ncbi:hypothetical protein WICMUC_001412 [Wickerhamomyces mucosus]|uniref:RRM domain-containing protein n=1 Tax=Wickerhamomyces mucosus TaxID=1378264 RepID=A0A9P8TH30_9ASCO|nr:hypothetical protein WICMUC_001412 [Wickerhamomyces mucosus]
MEVVQSSFNDQSNNFRINKVKNAAMSTLLGDNPKSNSHSDKLGVRRLAKACSKSFGSWNGNDEPDEFSRSESNSFINELEVSGTQVNSSKTHLFSLRNITWRNHVKKAPDPQLDINNWKSNFKEYNNKTENPSKPQIIGESNGSPPVHKSHSKSNENLISIVQELKLDPKFELLPIEKNSVETFNNLRFTPLNLEVGKRILRFKNFPSNVGLKAVIAQLCGGPLEKIELLRKQSDINKIEKIGNFPLKNHYLDVWYLKPEDAKEFYNFTKSGIFMVNGHNLQPEWAPPHNKRIQSINYTDIYSIKYGLPYHEEPWNDLEDEMMVNKARRCLIMKNSVPSKKSITASNYYSSSNLHYSELELFDIKKDFEQFGVILEVYPAVSKKLSLIIHFFDTRAAIDAKRAFDDELSDFHARYEDWTICYGKEPAERPCIDVG